MAKYVVNGLDIPMRLSTEELKTFVTEWNNVVKNGDIVYILGNFTTFGAGSVKIVLSQLNGTLVLIRGSHDGHLLVTDLCLEGVIAHVEEVGTTTYSGDKLYFLTHYPLELPENNSVINVNRGTELDYIREFSISGGIAQL